MHIVFLQLLSRQLQALQVVEDRKSGARCVCVPVNQRHLARGIAVIGLSPSKVGNLEFEIAKCYWDQQE
jgi:hypothetical protein